MDHQFKRLLNLVRRTGDRLVVTDPNGEDTYVLMGLEAYENLADRLPAVDSEPWDKPCCCDECDNDGFLDDYYDEDNDENIDIKDDWEVPNELLTNTVGAKGPSPITDTDYSPTKANDKEPQYLASNDHITTDDSTPATPSSSPATVSSIARHERRGKEDSSTSDSSTPSYPSKDIWDVMPPAGDKTETWNPEKFDNEDKKVVEDKFINPDFEPTLDKKDNDEPGEEQFYLEPIE